MPEATTTTDAPSKKPTMLMLLKQRNFRTLWLAQTVSWCGDHFSFLALMIVINQITGSAAAVAMLMIVMTVPRLVFGMAAGVFVDRWDRKRLMVISDVLRAALALSLIWIATPERIWLVYPIGFLISSVGVFFMPARGAVMKTILREDELLPANILMQTTFRLTVVAGPALAGVFIGLVGAGAAFAFDALTFVVSSSLVATMVVPRLARSKGEGARSPAFSSEFKEGLAFVASSRMVSGLLLVLTVVSLATGAINALFVPFLMNVLGVGATELGIADSFQGVGLVGGSLLAAVIVPRLRPNVVMSGALALASLVIISIGLAPSYAVVLALMLAVGLAVSPIEAVIPALIQKVVPLDKMGRVGGTMNTSQSVATLLSMGVAGALADVVGPRLIFVVAGVIGMISAVVALGAIRDDAPQAQPSAPASAVLPPAAQTAEASDG
jgi:predicted MFS family arabinose efflux permease